MNKDQKAELAREGDPTAIAELAIVHPLAALNAALALATKLQTENAELEKKVEDAKETASAWESTAASQAADAANAEAEIAKQFKISEKYYNKFCVANAKIEALTADKLVLSRMWDSAEKESLELEAKLAEATAQVGVLSGYVERALKYLEQFAYSDALLMRHEMPGLKDLPASARALLDELKEAKQRAVQAEHALRCAGIVTADQVPAITIKGEP